MLAVVVGLLSCLEFGCRGQSKAVPELAQAEQLVAKNKPRDAAALFERALAKGANPGISVRLGMLYAELGEWKRAAERLGQAHRARPEVTVASLLALARACSGDLDGARALSVKQGEERRGTELGLLVAAALVTKPDDAAWLRRRLEAWRDQRVEAAPAELLAGIGGLAQMANDSQAARAAYARVASARIADPTWAAGLALVHQRAGRLEAAERLLVRLLAVQPSHREGAVRLADVALASGDATLARGALARLPQQANEPPWLRTLRARLQLLDGNPQAACDQLANLPAAPVADNELTEARLLRARCLAQTGKVEEAERELGAQAALPAAAVRATLQLAELEIARDRIEPAIERLTALLAAHPQALWAHYWIGRARARQQQWPKASEAYNAYLERADQERPERRAEVLYRLAQASKLQGNVAQADRLLEGALAAHPDAIDALRALVALKPKPEAEARLRKQIDLAVHTVPVRVALAELLLAQGKTAEAEQMHHDAIAAEPDEIGGYTALANFELKRGKPTKAIETLEKARAKNGRHPVVLAMLAAAYAGTGQPARAAELYEQLIVLAPRSAPALNNLAFLYAESLGRLDDALALARRAQAIAPRLPEVVDTLGWVLAKRGEHAQALPLLEQASRELPSEPSVLFHLGATQLNAGDRAAGERTLRRALELGKPFPESAKATQLLAAK